MRLCALLVLAGLPWLGGGVNRKNREGAELYKQGKLEEALAAFTEAQVESPDAPEIHYNIGNVLFRLKELDGALGEYRAASRGTPDVAKRSQYGTGNALYRRENFEAAVAAYKAALKIEPNDIEARQNLELALRRQEQKEKGGGGEKERETDEQNPAQQDREQKQSAAPEEQPQEDRQQPKPAAPAGMSREDAERILAALEQAEKVEQRNQQQKRRVRSPAGGKDW
jgi:tetratricopeptide (TPR) repeat protein